MNNKLLIPPIIEQWVEKLVDPNINAHTKETYAANLERVRKAIDQSLIIYESNKKVRK